MKLQISKTWKGKSCSFCKPPAWWKTTQTPFLTKVNAFESFEAAKTWKSKRCSYYNLPVVVGFSRGTRAVPCQKNFGTCLKWMNIFLIIIIVAQCFSIVCKNFPLWILLSKIPCVKSESKLKDLLTVGSTLAGSKNLKKRKCICKTIEMIFKGLIYVVLFTFETSRNMLDTWFEFFWEKIDFLEKKRSQTTVRR